MRVPGSSQRADVDPNGVEEHQVRQESQQRKSIEKRATRSPLMMKRRESKDANDDYVQMLAEIQLSSSGGGQNTEAKLSCDKRPKL